MQISGVLLVLYLAHGHHVSAMLIGGRTSCGATTRTVTAASIVSNNCYRLTNTNANLACVRYSSKPTAVNYGSSLFTALCSDPTPLIQGPKFGIYNGANTYFADVQLVSSDTNAALGGLLQYLTYDPNTGYVNELITPIYDVTQVYSFILINKLTGATSDPIYFTAKILGCSLLLAGPSSITICTGPTATALIAAQALGPPTETVATFQICNPAAAGVAYDTAFGSCPQVTASSNNDFTPCYISTVSMGNTAIYTLAGPAFPIPFVKFTQTLVINTVGTNYNNGQRTIFVTFDPTCNTPTVTTSC